MREHDTIAAIATSLGEAGIGIVRVSGPRAFAVADAVFRSPRNAVPSRQRSHTVRYGWIVDPTQQDERIDEVLLTLMRAPRTFTREDVVEIGCHGGIVPLRRILEIILDEGCRLAEPGEFTKRAFLNGRIDLAQAEAVADIIGAKSEAARQAGVQQLSGELSARILSAREFVVAALAELSARIDFPEDETGADTGGRLRAFLNDAYEGLAALIATSHYGLLLREGVHVVICGRPNVGKSSLLNALLKKERAIVTAIPGTTRDTIEEIMDVRGVPVRIVDTAGIIEPRDLAEKKAVFRAKEHMRRADLVLLVVDASRRLTAQDRALMRRLKEKSVVLVANKADRPVAIEQKYLATHFHHVVFVSAKKKLYLGALEEAIVSAVHAHPCGIAPVCCLSNIRHIQAAKAAQKLIAQARESLDNNLAIECVAQLLQQASVHLDEVVGARYDEDVLTRIFSTFCIGK